MLKKSVLAFGRQKPVNKRDTARSAGENANTRTTWTRESLVTEGVSEIASAQIRRQSRDYRIFVPESAEPCGEVIEVFVFFAGENLSATGRPFENLDGRPGKWNKVGGRT